MEQILRCHKMCWIGKVASACLRLVAESPIVAIVMAYLRYPAVGTDSHWSKDAFVAFQAAL